MPRSDFAKHESKIAVALVLTFTAGFIDITGYMGIFHLFFAHLTGTTEHFANTIVLGERSEMIAAAAIVSSFFLGSVLGRVVIHAGARRQFRRIATMLLLMEAVLIAYVAGTSAASERAITEGSAPPYVYLYLVLLALAMGLQTATLTGVGPLTVHTTFVTGMINKLAQLVSHLLLRGYDFLRGRARTPENVAVHTAESRQAVFLFSIWVCYVGGAIGGTAAYLRWGMRALFLALGGLLIAIVTDLCNPLSIEEEQEESEW